MIPSVVLRLLDSFFRHPILHLLPIVVAGAAGVAYVSSQPPEYRSVGVVLVDEETFLGEQLGVRGADLDFQTPAGRAANELGSLFSTDSFTSMVAMELGLAEADERITSDEADELRSAVGSYTTGDNLLNVWAESEVPAEAQALASAAVRSYVQWQVDTEVGDSEAAEEFLATLVDEYALEVDRAEADLEAFLRDFPEPLVGDRSVIEQRDLDEFSSALERAEDRYQQAVDARAEAALATEQSLAEVNRRFRLIDEPLLPSRPTDGLRVAAVTVLAFLVLGGIATGATVVLGALLDTTVRFPGDVTRQLGLEVLSVLPEVRHRRMLWGAR